MLDFNKALRKSFSKFSQMGASRTTTRIFACLLVIWGSGLLYILKFDFQKLRIEDLSIFVHLFSLALVVSGLLWLKSTFTKKDYFSQHFDEKSIHKKMRLKGILSLFIATIFFSLFIAVGWYSGKIGFLIIGLIFMFIFVGGGIYMMVLTEKRIVVLKDIEPSELKYLSNIPFVLGNTLEFELLNHSPSIQGKDIQVSLSFIQEKYLASNNNSKKGNNSKAHQTISVYEETIQAQLINGSLLCQFTLPTENVGSTTMDFSEPEYWKLEFEEEPGIYYARFILDAQEGKL